MSKRSNDGGSSGRRFPLGVVLLAMTAAASLPLFVATAVGALDESAQPATGDAQAAGHGLHQTGLNTNRQEIGRGDSALGPYIMYTSTGPEGTCAEVELPETIPRCAGARAFYSDCSRDSDQPVNSAKIIDEAGTVVYGLVPEDTVSVELDRAIGGDLEATLRRGQRGEHKKFFIASSPGPDAAVTIRAVGANGQIATNSLPRAEPHPP
jgi:hypothetical protein